MKNWFGKVLAVVCVAMMLVMAVSALAEEQTVHTGTETVQEEESAGEKNEAASEALTGTDQEKVKQDSESEEGEAQTNKSPTWLSKLVKRLGETKTEAWIAFGTLIALFLVLRFAIGSAKKWNANMVSYGALSIALAFILSYIRLPVSWSGSITPGSMLPVMFFAAVYGMGPGFVAGLAYGLLQFLQKPEFLTGWQFILDYLLAFSALGLAGLAKDRKQKSALYISITIASLTRMLCAILAGVMWAFDSVRQGWALEIELFGTTHTFSPWPYSIVYNALYMIPETIICVVLAALIAKPVIRIMKGK